MNLERYTDKAQEALLAAHQQAQRAQNPDIEPEHLLRALVDQSTGVVPSILRYRWRTLTESSRGCRRFVAAPTLVLLLDYRQ